MHDQPHTPTPGPPPPAPPTSPPPRPPDPPEARALRWLLPVDRSLLSMMAGYAGLFSILLIPAPIALILGIVAIIDLRRRPGRLGMGRSVFAVVAGGLGSAVLVLALAVAIAQAGRA